MRGKEGISLALALVSLSSCSAVISDEYSQVTPHMVASLSGDSALIVVESYHELVNALVSLVGQHETTGKLRLMNYDKDLAKSHLNDAVVEVKNEMALGSFAVEGIQWELNSIVAHLECDLVLDYKITKAEVDQIIGVSSNSAMVRALGQGLEEMERRLVMQFSWGSTDRGQISQLVHQAFESAAQSIVEIPQIHSSFYPKEGAWRIVEVEFDYYLEESLRVDRQIALTAAISEKTSQLWVEGNEDIYGQLLEVLTQGGGLNNVGNTPWHVLVHGAGDSRGYALALLALCQEMGLDCLLVEGIYQEEPHFWNLISPQEGVYHHVDATQALGQEEFSGFLYCGQEEMEALGYSWDQSFLPVAQAYENL